MNTEKLSYTARKLEGFFKALQKILGAAVIVVAVFLVVVTIVNEVNPNAVIGTGVTHWTIGNLSFELAEAYQPDNGSVVRVFWISSIFGIARGVLVYAAFGYIRRILGFMAEGEPFRTEISVYLKRFAYLYLGLGIVDNIGMVVQTVFVRSFSFLETLVERGVVRSITTDCTFEFSFVVVFFVLLLMSYIFSYGAQLQQLSDETL